MPARFVLTALFVFLAFPLAAFAQGEPLRELRAVKLTNVASDVLFSDAAIAEAMDNLAALGINAVLPVVWNSSGADGTHTLHPSVVMDTTFGRPIHPRFAGRDVLQRVIIEAHRNGIEVLPWFEMGFSPSFSQDGGYMLAQKPEWAALDVDGQRVVENGFDWMSATHPEVQAFVHALTLEVAQNYDIDGVEYSDRIPAMPVRAGYDAATVALYQAEHDGADPPTNAKNGAWMRWRADRLNGFFRGVREAVKAEGAHLTVAASPSLYPWAYQNYLQDSKTWMDEGTADHIIPQVYRRSFSEYTFELDKSLRNYPGQADRYFSGMLIRLGSYTMADDYFRAAIAANRARGVNGEVFFFYEGLRSEGGRLSTVLESIYTEPALVPGRPVGWRPKGILTADEDAAISGNGTSTWTTQDGGFQHGGYRYSTDPDAGLAYSFDVPATAWYGVYAHGVSRPGAESSAQIQVRGADSAYTALRDQSDPATDGWHRIATARLEAGRQLVATIARDAPGTTPLLADDIMLLIDRKRSPEVVIPTATEPTIPAPLGAHLTAVAYPNPFTGATTLRLSEALDTDATITVFDVLGRQVLTESIAPSTRDVRLDLATQPSGLYHARIASSSTSAILRLIHVR